MRNKEWEMKNEWMMNEWWINDEMMKKERSKIEWWMNERVNKWWMKNEWMIEEWKKVYVFVVFRFCNKPNSIFNIKIKKEFLNLYHTLRLFNIHKCPS